MNNAILKYAEPTNMDELGYLPGSPEKASLKAELKRQYDTYVEVPCIINGKKVYSGKTIPLIMPDEKRHVLGVAHLAGEKELNEAKKAALQAHALWENMPVEHRFAIFLRAAELLKRNPYHDRISAATILNQSKTIVQTEGDSGSGLIDLILYDVFNCAQIYEQQPHSLPSSANRLEWRPLEGFVAAITPFNYVSDASNLAIAPAIAGNTVLWKPSSTSILSNYYVMEALMDAGLPAGVMNFLPSRGALFSEHVVKDENLAGIHFIGSTDTFRSLWRIVGENIATYRNFPRLAGETGGKNFMLAYKDCDVDALVIALIRGAFELQGQKCSATSRAYIPQSIWAEVKEKLLAQIQQIKVGPASDFSNFISAVIDQNSFNNIKRYIEDARASADAEILTGGYDDSVGFFVSPTVIVCKKPTYKTMVEEIFGPVLSVYVYPDEDLEEVVKLVNESTAYALTGAIFCSDRNKLAQLETSLRYAAGNLYLNDKSTGSMAGYIPFGGSRASGTNDKPGSMINMLKWVNPRTIKDSLTPPHDWRYDSLQEP